MTSGVRSATFASALALAALLCAPAAARPALSQPSQRMAPPRWAYPSEQAPVHASPSTHARVVGQLKFLTGDRQAQLYLAVGSATRPSGRRWLQIELPGRPNGRTGWVLRGALGSLHVTDGYLLIDRTQLRATLYRGKRPIFSAPIGVGKASTPTPAGHFYVLEKLTVRGNPTYGPYAVGTSAYAPTLSEWPGGGVVGIHGTDQPQLVPGRPSHGCIRLRNSDIARLWPLLALGTPVQIV